MIDVSGSMEGTSIVQAREALLNALDRLAPSDRFAILAFSSGYGEFAPEPLTASSQNLDAARRYVRNLKAGGGTEMLPALLHLMTKPTTPGYMRQIVLLTDGDLGNEEEIFSAMRTNLTKIESRPVHGKPWEYVFYVDCQIQSTAEGARAIEALKPHCAMVKELGTYREATKPQNID